MSRLFSLIIFIAVLMSFAAGLIFSINNKDMVVINFILFSYSLPVGLWILASLCLGVVIGMFASFGLRFGFNKRRQ